MAAALASQMLGDGPVTKALAAEDVPVAPVIYDDSDVACRRGPLGEVRYVPGEVPHDPEALASIFVREDGGAYSFQRQEILVRSAFFAQVLMRDCKLQRGDAVYFADAGLARRTEWIVACYRVGAVPIMVGPSVPNTFLHHPERMHIKVVLVSSRAHAEQITQMIKEGPEQQRDKDASILAGHEDLLGRPRSRKPIVLMANETMSPDLAFPAEIIAASGQVESREAWFPVWPRGSNGQTLASMEEVATELRKAGPLPTKTRLADQEARRTGGRTQPRAPRSPR